MDPIKKRELSSKRGARQKKSAALFFILFFGLRGAPAGKYNPKQSRANAGSAELLVRSQQQRGVLECPKAAGQPDGGLRPQAVTYPG